MKAAVYEKGLPGLFVTKEVDKPIPVGGEVLVKIHAASANALDYRSIRMGIIPKDRIYGADIAGVVEAAGPNAKEFKPGDEVIGDISGCGLGGFAEYAAVKESVLIRKPRELSFEEAAALPVAALTALQALRMGNIKEGRKVLICGSGGGVGTYAVQLAKLYGAKITAVCGTKNVELSYSLGAEKVIDYTKEDFTKQSERYDLIVGVNGKYPISAYMGALNPGGILVILGGALSQIFKAMLFGWAMSSGGKKARLLAAKPSRDDLELLAGYAKDGKIKPVIEKVYSLSEAGEAVWRLEKERPGGKTVIKIV